ncbi:hypothetical protein QBC46DRAFT_349371 [Diplogelasinospora grovesii]|uniref:Uncharacterized protein n=1 Tax=Diplogelasinospora grovesii TaxID=303347 RepID=A0AAN6S9K3_9PEZI|nr:hypothetical protein QBC46DRAFT_349371 [Diplogelasinospora grovesii]
MTSPLSNTSPTQAISNLLELIFEVWCYIPHSKLSQSVADLPGVLEKEFDTRTWKISIFPRPTILEARCDVAGPKQVLAAYRIKFETRHVFSTGGRHIANLDYVISTGGRDVANLDYVAKTLDAALTKASIRGNGLLRIIVPRNPVEYAGDRLAVHIRDISRALSDPRKIPKPETSTHPHPHHPHKDCDGAAILQCIEEELHKQKLAHDALRREVAVVAAEKPNLWHDATTLVNVVDHIAALVKHSYDLVYLFDNNVGRAPRGPGLWNAARDLVKPEYGALAVRDKAIEQLKDIVRRDCVLFYQAAYGLVPTIRVFKQEEYKHLKRAMILTDGAPERMFMATVFGPAHDCGLRSSNYHPPAESAGAAAINGHYWDIVEAGYRRMVASIEALNKALGDATHSSKWMPSVTNTSCRESAGSSSWEEK